MLTYFSQSRGPDLSVQHGNELQLHISCSYNCQPFCHPESQLCARGHQLSLFQHLIRSFLPAHFNTPFTPFSFTIISRAKKKKPIELLLHTNTVWLSTPLHCTVSSWKHLVAAVWLLCSAVPSALQRLPGCRIRPMGRFRLSPSCHGCPSHITIAKIAGCPATL